MNTQRRDVQNTCRPLDGNLRRRRGARQSRDIIVKQHGGSIEVETEPGEFAENAGNLTIVIDAISAIGPLASLRRRGAIRSLSERSRHGRSQTRIYGYTPNCL